MSKINCSVGVLTNNSSNVIERCLFSLKDFREIIICDGGSTDETLNIARKYGCKIINQDNNGLFIEDFSKQRNLMIDASSCDWFLYIDADEIMTAELANNIKTAIESTVNYNAYRLKYNLCSPDFKNVYYQYPESKQIRLFRIDSGARFIKKIHERIDDTKENLLIGELDGYWLVPLDEQLNFSVYKSKVDYRMKILIDDAKEVNFLKLVKVIIFRELVKVIKIILRLILSRIIFINKKHVPIRYDLYRLYSPVLIIFLHLKKYFSL